MKEPMLWTFFLQLSNHMWGDETSAPRIWYPTGPAYTPENNTDVSVWDETVRFLAGRKFNAVLIDVGDGVRYDTHPEISAPDAWSKDFLKKKLDEMRALGIEPFPKLNFSAGHDTWLKRYRRMLSTDVYRQVCRDLIGELCEAFSSPRLFHLGLDEEKAANQARYDTAIIRGDKLWWEDAFNLFDACGKNGARPWIWGDRFWWHKEDFVANMPRSVLISNWCYLMLEDYPADHPYHTRIGAYEELERYGYDQIPTCSTWRNTQNTEQTMRHGQKVIAPERLKGFMTASWAHTTRKNVYTILKDADYYYYARQAAYPESLK